MPLSHTKNTKAPRTNQGLQASNKEDPELTLRADRLETLLQNLPGMAYRCLNLAHWPMDFVSQGCINLCGYEKHEIESQKILWGDFTHPDDLDYVDKKVRTASDTGKPFEVEYRIISRDGTEKWVWERGRAVDVREDGVAIIEGFITDITDRKAYENALRHAESFSQAIVDSAVEAVITLDGQGIPNRVNKTAVSMFGYEIDTIKQLSASELFAPGHIRTFDQYFKKCRENEFVDDKGMDLNARRVDSLIFPVHVLISEIEHEAEEKYVMLIRDLTSQKAAEKEAQEQRELLAHVDRINTLGEMAAGIAHEINQPLTAISMYAKSGLSFLESTPHKTDRLKDALQKLSAQAHRAGDVIERMQQMTRPGAGKQSIVNCNIMIQGALKLAEVEASLRNFNILLDIADDLPNIVCDEVQIQQVILNLLRNGIDSMECVQNDNRDILLTVAKDANGVRISVKDTGTGISGKLDRTLYQPFTSTRESGMGLGLSISRSIVSEHGGELSYHNNPDCGATFYFILPSTDIKQSY
jgi:two-component system sensor kinase FixL